MPKLDSATAALFMSRRGADMLIGNTMEQIHDNPRSDQLAGDGEVWYYRNVDDEQIIQQVYDKTFGFWRAHALI